MIEKAYTHDDEYYYQIVRQNIRKYRKARNLTQQKLAEILGVSVVTINHWLTRKAKVNKINEYQIKKLLNEVQQNDKEQ